MTLAEQVYAHACVMAPELSAENQSVMEAVCRGAVVSLENKLRSNLSVDDCLDDFVMAAAMCAVAAMSEISDLGQVEQFTAGDLTVRRNGSTTAANCLRMQAEMLMAPYVKTRLAFMGV